MRLLNKEAGVGEELSEPWATFLEERKSLEGNLYIEAGGSHIRFASRDRILLVKNRDYDNDRNQT